LLSFGKQLRPVCEDALNVTSVDDLTAYVLSMADFAFVREWPQDRLQALLAQQMEDSIIHIPKEYGLFQCYEPNVTKIFD